MVSKETDVTVGPILKRRADRAGLVYTAVDGDQHGLLMGLVQWARALGLEVLCGGKSLDSDRVYDPQANAIVWSKGNIRIPDRRTFAAQTAEGPSAHVAQRRNILGRRGAIAGYDITELTIAANATGLVPDTDTLHTPIVRTVEIPEVLAPKEDGGILSHRGVIDCVSCLRQPGEPGLGGGVFIVVACENAYSRRILTTKGLISNAKGSAALIYRPYHLCGVETPITALVAGLLNLPTGATHYRPQFDIVARAKERLKTGDPRRHGSQRESRIPHAPCPARRAGQPPALSHGEWQRPLPGCPGGRTDHRKRDSRPRRRPALDASRRTRRPFSPMTYRCQLARGQRGAREAALRGDVLVVVDTLSFSTSAITAIQNGGVVFPRAKGEDVEAYARRVHAECAVGRDDVPAKGRFSLSPLTYLDLEPQTRIALASPNGATCIRYAHRVPILIVGALLNAQSVAHALSHILRTTDDAITLLACGERYVDPDADGPLRHALEDDLGAGAIASYLSCEKSPEVRACEGAFLPPARRLVDRFDPLPERPRALRQGLCRRRRLCCATQRLRRGPHHARRSPRQRRVLRSKNIKKRVHLCDVPVFIFSTTDSVAKFHPNPVQSIRSSLRARVAPQSYSPISRIP